MGIGGRTGSDPALARIPLDPPALYRRLAGSHIDPRKASKGRHMAPAIGEKAPGFALPRDGGGTVKLADFKGRNLVLYFYPKADTPGCTKEAIAFNGLQRAFASVDTDVVGVSADPVKAQDKFRDKHKLAIPLASDETKKMLTAYGVWGEK